MAKWGEGDPRWIVEERPDATNVNNWHWTEKNADAWSKNKIRELFSNLIIEEPKVGNVAIEEVEKVEGEARANNRKGKLIFFYEWDISLKWKGFANGKDVEVLGKIDIPNLSEEHEDMEDVDVDVSLTSKGPEADLLKEMLRKGSGAKQLRQTLAAYVTALKTEFSTGLILPKKGENGSAALNTTTTSQLSVGKDSRGSSLSNATKDAERQMGKVDIGGCRIELDDIRLEETMKCTGQELFNALTQREMIQLFTGGPAVMSDQAEKGGDFQYLGGNITGKFLEVVPFTKIVQEWRLKSWPAGLHSMVEITIQQTKEDTKITIVQRGVPVKEVENTRIGWHRYYFDAMKRTFGFGAMLF